MVWLADGVKFRNPSIDSLRGVSIVLVVFFHIRGRFPILESDLAEVLPRRLLNLFTDNGFAGVTMFFVISGFLITKHTLRRYGSLGNICLRDDYLRRAARILPLLLALIAILSLLHLLGLPGFVIQGEGLSLGRTIFATLFFHLNGYGATTGALPAVWDVLWSLSILEVFYIGFPLVCLTLRKEWLLMGGCVLLACSLPFLRAGIDDWVWMHRAYAPSMASLAAGVLGALLSVQVTRPSPWVSTAIRWTGGLGLWVVLSGTNLLWPFMGHWTMLLLTLSTSALLLGMEWEPPSTAMRPWLGLGWLRSFGRHSYEFYLCHMFVVLGWNGMTLYFGQDVGLGYLWYLPILFVTWIPAYGIRRYVSGPTERALRRRWGTEARA